MANQIVNYKCPSCTGPLEFSGTTGKLECPYCGSSYEVKYIEELYAQQEETAKEEFTQAEEKRADQQAEGGSDWWDQSGLNSDWGADAGKMRAYSCPSCGAELICDDTTAATSCPYCGNNTIVPGQFSGSLKPDYVIPFKVTPEEAKEKLLDHYRHKPLLPSVFAKDNKVKEIKGVYVPFWLFDGEAEADVRFEATNTDIYESGDYEITETEHYSVRRCGRVSFEKIPVDASSKMPDEYMDAIEPFDYDELQEFSTAFLPGHLADKFDVSVQDSSARADQRAVNTAVYAMRQDVHAYDTCIEIDHDVELERGQVKYALMPVYMMTTRWNGQEYMFAVNGQTGKTVGKLPISKGKMWGWLAGITAAVTAVLGTILLYI